jgi:hypothetical protein
MMIISSTLQCRTAMQDITASSVRSLNDSGIGSSSGGSAQNGVAPAFRHEDSLASPLYTLHHLRLPLLRLLLLLLLQ